MPSILMPPMGHPSSFFSSALLVKPQKHYLAASQSPFLSTKNLHSDAFNRSAPLSENFTGSVLPNHSHALMSGMVVTGETYPNTIKSYRLDPETIDENSIPDFNVRVFASVAGKNGKVKKRLSGLQGKQVQFNLRSSAKLVQALPGLEACKRQGIELTPEMVAVLCASHDGLPEQGKVVREFMKLVSLKEEDLLCGKPPWSMHLLGNFSRVLTAGKFAPFASDHMCSGNHAILAAAQKLNGWEGSYGDEQGPLQKDILKRMQQYTEEDAVTMQHDNCGVPTFNVTLDGAARLAAKIASNQAFAPIRDGFSKHPEMVAGPGVLDTVLMQKIQGTLITKMGADGVRMAANTETGEGLYLTVDVPKDQYPDFAFLKTLASLGWISSNTLREIAEENPGLSPHMKGENGHIIKTMRYLPDWEDASF